jgi:probable F420-dependent oxidoreductase
MNVDAILGAGLADASSSAAHAERAGCDGIMVPEVAHDPFVPLTVAAASTTRVRLVTGIAVAFARNPMSVAVTASDLHRFFGGRFVLGLGSQIKPQITRRFSMTWSDPTRRMKEFVAAVRAIWAAWQTGTPLRFRGDFYQHTLMTPMFDHGPSPCGWPPIHIAAVGPAMTTAAGEVADGLICHGFTTAAYLRDVTIPRLERGLAHAGRSRNEVEVSVPVMAAVADDGHTGTLDAARSIIAFYGSTPAYRPVLEHHGWGALGEELHSLSRRGEWSVMGSLLDDEVMDTVYAIGDVAEVATKVRSRFGEVVDRLQVAVHVDDKTGAELVAALQAHAQAP